MTGFNSRSLCQDFASLFATGTLANLADFQLLDEFIARRNHLAFEELVARHGPMVLSICRRWLDNPHDIEDAFQSTFLILVRKAARLQDRNALSSWLYGVALRVVRRARKGARQRQFREQPLVAEPAARPHAQHECRRDEVFTIVDQEIGRLPQNQQVAVVLCLLEGLTHQAAASKLGWSLGTVKSRIATARETLTRRLTRRGLTRSGLAAVLRTGSSLGGRSTPISAHFVRLATKSAANSLANASLVRATIPAPIASLVRYVPKLMLFGESMRPPFSS